MSFTYNDAEEMVGDSTDYRVGMQASILKWEQIIREEYAGEDLQYGRSTECGLCLIANNLRAKCVECPAYGLCGNIHDDTDPAWVLEQLCRIESELEEPDEDTEP